MMARLINQTLGTAVEPGEVDDLPREFIDTVLALNKGLPEIQQGLKKEEELFAEWRRKHPTYRK